MTKEIKITEDGRVFRGGVELVEQKPEVEIPEGFTPWHGGDCPIPDADKGEHELVLRSGKRCIANDKAKEYQWRHYGGPGDIIGYRLLEKDITKQPLLFGLPNPLWVPDEGEEYRSINPEGLSSLACWDNDRIDRNRHKVGNVYHPDWEGPLTIRSEEEMRVLRVIAEVRHELTPDWVLDFTDREQMKYFLAWCSYYKEQVVVGGSCYSQVESKLHYFPPECKKEILRRVDHDDVRVMCTGVR